MESAFGFKNIKPRTRLERKSLNDKVALEKNRINQRVGFAARMHRANAPEETSGLTSCLSDGAGYISNAERFHSDTAGEEFENRQHSIRRKQQIDENKRQQVLNREDERWKGIDERTKQEEEYWNQLREEGSKAKKNSSAVAYDITTLQYHNSDSGLAQKYQDDMVRYRAQVRTRNLTVQGDTRAAYNIISGADRYIPSMPEKVQAPTGQSGRELTVSHRK